MIGEELPYLVFVPLLSRGLTFLANQILLRFLSPSVFGASAQLELYMITVLYFSRENIRLCLQRSPNIAAKSEAKTGARTEELQAIVNVSYLAAIIGVPLSYILILCYRYLFITTAESVPFFVVGLGLSGFACVIELLAEPLFEVIRFRSLYKTRAMVETVAAVSKSVIICSVTVKSAQKNIDLGILPFSIGYAAYSLSMFCGYLVSSITLSKKLGFSLLPRQIHWR